MLSVPSGGFADTEFPGYPENVQAQASRVVEAADPGSADALASEVRSLRKLMFAYGILSVNAIPDQILERATEEGWERKASVSLREVTKVAPLSVPLWAWLIREDITRVEPELFLSDLSGLQVALETYGPVPLGYAAWVLLFAAAAACWFSAWASIALLLRARPALTADIARAFRALPKPEVPAALVVLALFVVPVLAGAGLGVCAVFWIALSAGYLRRGELAIATTAVLLLLAVFFCGGFLHSIDRLAGDIRQGGWLEGEGYFPQRWPGVSSDPGSAFAGPKWEGILRFSRARAQMQGENPGAAERAWSELIRDGIEVAGSYNNRGLVRVRLGKTDEGLSDFEAAAERTPQGGPAHWNAYQLYLQMFRLEEARRVQPIAWASIRGLSPLGYRGEEMTHGELIPSPLPVGDVWKTLFTLRADWFRQAEGSPFRTLFFRPLSGGWVPLFLAAGWFCTTVWKLLSRKIWLHSTCRSCGTRTMVVGARESSDICNPCRAQLGVGVRGEDERARRIQSITLHRRYVRACSVLFPGTGALWAGKDLQAMVYGLALCLPLGALSVSMRAGSTSRPLILDMETLVAWGAIASIAILWAAGAWWGWRSFDLLQLRYNIAGERS